MQALLFFFKCEKFQTYVSIFLEKEKKILEKEMNQNTYIHNEDKISTTI
jgi:hypothetical protein